MWFIFLVAIMAIFSSFFVIIRLSCFKLMFLNYICVKFFVLFHFWLYSDLKNGLLLNHTIAQSYFRLDIHCGSARIWCTLIHQTIDSFWRIFMNPLHMLLEIPFSQEHFRTILALNILFDATLVIHVTQHDIFRGIPLTTLGTLEILSILAIQFEVGRLVGHRTKAETHEIGP